MTPTSKLSWENPLKNLLSLPLKKAEPGSEATVQRGAEAQPAPRIAIVGVGHELRGDDAAGLAVARGLQPAASGQEHILVIVTGPVPENFTGPLRRFSPALILFVDAAQMDEPPGAVRLLDWQETSGVSAVTHSLPIYVLAGYLASELGCEVALLGIQPEGNAIAGPLSSPVQNAVEEVVRVLIAHINGSQG